MPEGAPLASRSTSKTENGRRSSGSKPGAGLTITNWPGSAAAAIAGAAERDDVVVRRQSPVVQDRRREVDDHPGEYINALGRAPTSVPV